MKPKTTQHVERQKRRGEAKSNKFQVTFTCDYQTLVSIELEAPDADRATGLARASLQHGQIQVPQEETASFESVLTGTQLKAARLIKTRPCPDVPYDLTGLELKKHLQTPIPTSTKI